jgi:hypothetical protein
MARTVQPFSHYEIHRCVELVNVGRPFTEQVDTDEELEALKQNTMNPDLVPFWTLYGRYAPRGSFGGLEAIADRDTWDECATLLESILGRALGELGSDEPWPAHAGASD